MHTSRELGVERAKQLILNEIAGILLPRKGLLGSAHFMAHVDTKLDVGR